MTSLANQTSETAPRDGRVYRGFFERAAPRDAMFIAVSWNAERGWVDLHGDVVGSAWRLSAWTPD
jgi:hypothetical protein